MSALALLLGDDFGIFLAVARSLGRIGVAVDVVPSELDAPGLASRYIGRTPLLPPYHADPARWLDSLGGLIAAGDYRFVIPCSDAGLALLDLHGDALGRARLLLPNREAIDAFSDKLATRRLAEANGVPVARGMELGPGKAANALERALGLPLVLKPRRSYRIGDPQTKRAAIIAADRPELEAALAGIGEDWLAESFFPGTGVGLSVLAERGQVRLAWQHRRLATVSATGGSSARTGESADPALLREVATLAKATGLDGVAMFEFRRNPAGGYILLEVNPRFWGSLPLAIAAGADFPATWWRQASGEPVPRPAPARIATARRSLSGEFDRLTATLRTATGAGERIAATGRLAWFVASLAARRDFDSWSKDDPAPFLRERAMVLRRTFGGVPSALHFFAGRRAPLRGRVA